MTAHEVVDVLLEAVRVCADCQKEFGTKPPVGASHGYCRRHAIIRYTDALGDRQAAETALASKPDEAFSPDMAQDAQQAQQRFQPPVERPDVSF